MSETTCPVTGKPVQPAHVPRRTAAPRPAAPPPPPPPAPEPPARPVRASPGVMALVGKVVDGRYGIRSVIGEGGMGAVYEAEHLVLGRRVALKVLHPTNAAKPEAVSRFMHEARVVSSIGHPNICELYDVGKLPDGTPFLVIERLVGDTLAERITREGALPHEVVLDTLIQILGALSAAHRKGIIHRDIKPENIFLARTPGSSEPIAKLLDFGISKMAALDEDLHLTRTGMVMGTPYYMAPEQARGERIDPRVDLYAVGVILYEGLTGRRPFLAPNYNALLVQILSGQPKPLRSLRPALSESFEPLVQRAMQKQPDARFQNAAEFHEALVRLRSELAHASRKAEAARLHAASQPPPPLKPSLPPSVDIPVHFSPGTGSGEIHAPPAPRLPVLHPNETGEHPPFVTVSPSAIAPDTYVDDGPPTFDEATQVEAPPFPIPPPPPTEPAPTRQAPPRIPEADRTVPSRPLDLREAEEIIQSAQKRARSPAQNPLKPATPLAEPRRSPSRLRERPAIPRDDGARAEGSVPRPRSAVPRPSAKPTTLPSEPPTAPAPAPSFPVIEPDPAALRAVPLPRDLAASLRSSAPSISPPSLSPPTLSAPPPPPVPPALALPVIAPAPPPPAPAPPVPAPASLQTVPAPPPVVDSPKPRSPAVPHPFAAAPKRPAVPAPTPSVDDDEPTRLYQPGKTKLPPEAEKLLEAARNANPRKDRR